MTRLDQIDSDSLIEQASERVMNGYSLSREELINILELPSEHLPKLYEAACRIRAAGKRDMISFSPKVFIPLTMLCRDNCSYCTFRKDPSDWNQLYLSPDEVLAIARAGEKLGCREALFTLGERPEQLYPEAREWLANKGYASTIDYLVAMCDLVLRETSLLPHSNPGTMNTAEILKLREVNASLGMMLESVSTKLIEPGGCHEFSPSKHPQARLLTIERAGKNRVPFTTGLLLGLGDTPVDQLDGLLAIRDLHDRYGHIQEIIIQNFRAKPQTGMSNAPEPGQDYVKRMAAMARLVFGPEMNIQVPPNLTADYQYYLEAGINDWGGISPVTPDHVNPERPWPHISELRQVTESFGLQLRARYPVYPEYLHGKQPYLNDRIRSCLEAEADPEGYIPFAKEQW
jgi:7,8-didemethyl-8-hydroxy-5-deazariboflavin synthase CofG subunit